jgi:hypothetical protein
MQSQCWSKTCAAACLGLALAVLGCGGVMTGPSPVAGPPTGWTDSTLTVQPGDQITFAAAGTIDMWPNCEQTKVQEGYPDMDCKKVMHVRPEGVNVFSPGLSDYPMPGANVMALVGRVGTGPAFLVATQATVTVQQSGELQLVANDLDWRKADDHGWYLVKVTVAKRTVVVAVR